jgi:hypothetical protein
MPKVARESAEVEDVGILADRHGDLDGYTVNFLTFREDLDATPLLRGASDDQCQSMQIRDGHGWFRTTDLSRVKRAISTNFSCKSVLCAVGTDLWLPPGRAVFSERCTIPSRNS